MKYFFVRKHEFSQEKSKDHKSILNVYLINSENLLRKVINAGQIDKFRKITPFKTWDLVQLTSVPPIEWTPYMLNEYLGKTVTITAITPSYIEFIGCNGFSFRSCNVENVMGN